MRHCITMTFWKIPEYFTDMENQNVAQATTNREATLICFGFITGAVVGIAVATFLALYLGKEASAVICISIIGLAYYRRPKEYDKYYLIALLIGFGLGAMLLCGVWDLPQAL